MLSILIPIYNFDVCQLVRDLQQQCLQAAQPFEIICLDDESEQVFQEVNQSLAELEGVHYQVVEQNLGRSRIRNRLAEMAQFDYLLYLDCDSGLPSKQFIVNYLDHLSPSTVLCGGRSYATTPPTDKHLYLHWLYGTQREAIPAPKRQAGQLGFMSNNFVIPKTIFHSIRFEESLRQYGHEDTLFGIQLTQQKVTIRHIDNPAIHLGLESQTVFLQKTILAIENLRSLHLSHPEISTKLLRIKKRLDRWGITPLMQNFHTISKPWLLRNLKGNDPSLFIFDLYKLGEMVAKK